MLTQFQDRKEAGKLLAAKLTAYANKQDVIVLALPRGGVPVGFEVAKHFTFHWMSWLLLSLAYQDKKNWRWVLLRLAVCAYSITMLCNSSVYPMR